MQGISCADVADICVKALHDSTARNKSFDVGLKFDKSDCVKLLSSFSWVLNIESNFAGLL
jgi:hypothetical protein